MIALPDTGTKLVIAFGCAVWAGFLVLATQAAIAGNSRETRSKRIARFDRALRVAGVALLVISGIAGALVVRWWDRPLLEGVATAGVTLALLFMVADAVPRALAVLLPKLGSFGPQTLRSLLAAFTPLVVLSRSIERRIERRWPAETRAAERFGPAHRDMLLGVFSLGETTAAEAMTPRLDVAAVEHGSSWRELVDLLARSDHSRLPIYRKDLDDIVGILHAKDLTSSIVGVAPPPKRWQALVRPAQFVPESKSLRAQLRDFQRTGVSVAIVVDEYGGTSGLITLEDVLEEVVGEIHGEYDDATPAIEQEGDDRFWVDGSVTLDELSELLGNVIERDEITTVGGLVYSELGRVPHPGEELRIDEFRVVVEQVIRRRVRRVYFERTEQRVSMESEAER